ncbi:hypothetical protein BOX15_Mlig009921g1, partial [Macrostomum lignano]
VVAGETMATSQPFAELRQCRLAELRVVKQIGRGSFGSVHKCVLNGRHCALKKLNLANSSVRPEWIRNRLVKEILLLHQVSTECDAFVRIYSSCTDDDGQVVGYVMEYFKFGNLRTVFNTMKSFRLDCQNFPWLAVHLLHQVAEGLRFLQENRQPVLMHRDVAVDNVFVDMNLRAKLGDFGLSRSLQDSLGQDTLHFENLVGIERRPPELLLDPLRRPDEFIDRYLFGICLFEALTCSSLRHRIGDSVAEFRDMLIEGRHVKSLTEALDRDCFNAYPQRLRQPAEEFECLHSAVTNIMQSCLASEPNLRPPFSRLCQQLEELGLPQSEGVSREKDLAYALLQSDESDSAGAAAPAAEADIASGCAATNGDAITRTTGTIRSSLHPGDSGMASAMPSEFRHQLGTALRVGLVQGKVFDVDAPPLDRAEAQQPQQRRFTGKPAPIQLLQAIFRSGPLRNTWPELLSALGAPEQAVNDAALAARKDGRLEADAAMDSLRLLPAPPTVRQLADGLAAARCSDSTLRLLSRLQDKFCSPLSSVDSSGVR